MNGYVSPLDPHPGENGHPTGLRGGPVPAPPATPTTARRAGWVTWAGLGIVLVAAAVLSFHALRDLALAVGIPAYLAWLLPIAVDAGAAVSCSAWLSNRCPADAASFARSMTFGLLALTVVGNAAQLGMHAAGLAAPWWVAVLVGAIPPSIVGGSVHLAVLAARGDSAAPDTAVDEVDEQPPGEGPDPAVDLIAQGAGRRRLARELGVSEHQARELIARHRDGRAS